MHLHKEQRGKGNVTQSSHQHRSSHSVQRTHQQPDVVAAGLIGTETSSYNSEKTGDVTKLTQMNTDLATCTAQLQAEFASIQATIWGYQPTEDFLNSLNASSSDSR